MSGEMTAMAYLRRAEECATLVEHTILQIGKLYDKAVREAGGHYVAMLQLNKDPDFNDLVGDRNRYIQMTTMYGTLALAARKIRNG